MGYCLIFCRMFGSRFLIVRGKWFTLSRCLGLGGDFAVLGGLIGLGGLGGGEAEDAVAGEDFVTLEPALGDFQSVAEIREGAAGGVFVQGLEVVDLADDAGGVDVSDRQRDEGAPHPEAEWSGFAKDKEHAGAFGEVSPSHQTRDALVGFVGHFCLDRAGPDPERDGGQGVLRCGIGRGGAGEKLKAGEEGEREEGAGFAEGGRGSGVRSGHDRRNSASGQGAHIFFVRVES